MKVANSESRSPTKKNMKQLKSQKIVNNKEDYIEFYRNLSLKNTSSDELVSTLRRPNRHAIVVNHPHHHHHHQEITNVCVSL
jgi:uncharacterized membrane protein